MSGSTNLKGIPNKIKALALPNERDSSFESFLIATTEVFRKDDDAEIGVKGLIMQSADETRRRAEMRDGSSSGDENASMPASSFDSDALVSSGRGEGSEAETRPANIARSRCAQDPLRGAGDCAHMHLGWRAAVLGC